MSGSHARFFYNIFARAGKRRNAAYDFFPAGATNDAARDTRALTRTHRSATLCHDEAGAHMRQSANGRLLDLLPTGGYGTTQRK